MDQNTKNCFLFDRCNHKDCMSEFCQRKYKLEFLFNNSLLSKTQREHIPLYPDDNNFEKEAFRSLQSISESIDLFVIEGRNLYIHSSNCGNGKTSWAVRCMQRYFDKIWAKTDLKCHALFISVPRYLLEIKDFKNEENEYLDFIKTNVRDADLVVWDDIAAKTGSEWELSNLLSLIDWRLVNGKSNIFTSNLGPSEMGLAVGERLASRICHTSIDIELRGADKRGLKGELR